MVRLGNLLIRALAPAALCVLALAACGSQPKSSGAGTTSTTAGNGPPHRTTVLIYSSLPSRGPERGESKQIEQGITLALKPMAGSAFNIVYKPLPDSPKPVKTRRRGGPDSPSISDRATSGTLGTRGSSGTKSTATKSTGTNAGWSASVSAQNAATAARHPQTVAYIGDLNSGATEVSVPILNQAGIVQITPGSGYPGLTDAYKYVTEPNTEPGKYYPQSPRNLLRLIPSDVVQAAAALSLLHSGGCQTFAAWEFGGATPEATALINAVIRTAPQYAMKHINPPPLTAKNYSGYVEYVDSLRPSDIHCAIMVGHPTSQASTLTLALREQLSSSPAIVGTGGFCDPAWVRGIPKVDRAHVVPGLYCMTPARPIATYSGSTRFIAKFVHAYHRRPTVYAYYGYAAAGMVIRALKGATTTGADYRQQVLQALVQEFSSYQQAPFTFDAHGNVESDAYGVETFKDGGQLVPSRPVAPTSYLLPSAG